MTTVKHARLFVRIAAVQGASSAVIQGLLADFAARAASSGMIVAGVVEVAGGDGRGSCGSLAVRDLSTGAVIPISQDLGPGSIGCNLDPAGLAAACAAVERGIAAGADLVVMSKFGKQEAARGGLSDAFRAAVSAGLPILTAVSPAVSDAWLAFAGDLSEFVAADGAALDDWWLSPALGLLAAAE